jgi:hypothetical protein
VTIETQDFQSKGAQFQHRKQTERRLTMYSSSSKVWKSAAVLFQHKIFEPSSLLPETRTDPRRANYWSYLERVHL